MERLSVVFMFTVKEFNCETENGCVLVYEIFQIKQKVCGLTFDDRAKVLIK